MWSFACRFWPSLAAASRPAGCEREILTPDEATPAREGRYPKLTIAADGKRPAKGSVSISKAAAVSWQAGEATGKSKGKPGEKGEPWRILVNDLAVSKVDEIWVGAWRWRGTGRVEGSFELLPQKEARVGPARLGARYDLGFGKIYNTDKVSLQTSNTQIKDRLSTGTVQLYVGIGFTQ